MQQKQKMMQENNENWEEKQIFIDGKDNFFGQSDFMNFRKMGQPVVYLIQILFYDDEIRSKTILCIFYTIFRSENFVIRKLDRVLASLEKYKELRIARSKDLT
jgi:hypothetical protein